MGSLKKLGTLLVTTVVLATPAWGGYKTLDSSAVLDFAIARTGSTRIALEGDTIADVFILHSEPQNVAVVKSGFVFINPEFLEEPLYMTLITARGIAQDLRLIPKSQKAVPIVLRAPAVPAAQPDPQEAAAAILSHFMGGKVPSGFVPTSVPKVRRGTSDLEATLERAYRNPSYTVIIFAIKNGTAQRVSLDQAQKTFWAQQDVASAFDQATLGPDATARLYVLQSNHSF